MRIENSIALVTGSARRIGRAITLELARRGARVVVHYRSSEDDARRTLDEVRRIGAEGAMFQADLTVDEDRARLFEGIRDEWGALDILVNSASVFESRRFDETTPDFWDSQMDANARAPFFVAQAAARLMKGREGAKIINIADPAGELIWPQYLAYSISKSALLGLNRGLAKALAPGIQVNAVAPGPVHFPENYTDDQKRAAIERTVLKRAGSTDDVVRAVIFLIENDYITGEVLHVDGGRHIL
jgi:NAD(P)-dependent dehydrogenase (short-subunit alcohol dehydrogenase family)